MWMEYGSWFLRDLGLSLQLFFFFFGGGGVVCLSPYLLGGCGFESTSLFFGGGGLFFYFLGDYCLRGLFSGVLCWKFIYISLTFTH